jgi:DNA-directed RNA polymerase specialized sigma24 family protein
MKTMLDLDEALAVARLRQWARMKISNAQGRSRSWKREGWQQRNERTFDAAQVQVIDFERAMNALPDEQKIALIWRYRDGASDERTALALGCSVRKVSYLVPMARRALASILDRLNLL